MGAQLRQRFRRRQPRILQTRAEGRIRLALGVRQRPQRLRDLWVLLFPEPIAAEGRWCAHAEDPGAVLLETPVDSLAAPPEHPLRLAGMVPALFQRHRRLEGAALGADIVALANLRSSIWEACKGTAVGSIAEQKTIINNWLN